MNKIYVSIFWISIENNPSKFWIVYKIRFPSKFWIVYKIRFPSKFWISIENLIVAFFLRMYWNQNWMALKNNRPTLSHAVPRSPSYWKIFWMSIEFIIEYIIEIIIEWILKSFITVPHCPSNVYFLNNYWNL